MTKSVPQRGTGDTVRRSTTLLMAVATGVAVANIYYAQPLEDTLAGAMGVPAGSIGVMLTLLQVSFAAGLATVVPLGDLVDRRRLLAVTLSLCVAGTVVLATAPSTVLLDVGAVLVGVGAVTAQIIVPFAAHVAEPERQGEVVGTVMSGLLLGILLSRTVSGLIAEFAGWRAVFVMGAVATALVGLLLLRTLPTVPPATDLSYPRLLGSVLALVRDEPVLRVRMLYGALVFAAFSVLWSSVGFLLAGPAYGWNDAEIGLIALVGVAGALVARPAGKLADRGHAVLATGAFLAILAVSFLILWLGGTSVIALTIGVAVLDLGCQGAHLSNQSVIYRIRDGVQSRVNTAYMTSYFIGGAAGSALAAVVVHPAFGWDGVCVLGGGFAVLGLLVWAADRLRNRTVAARPA